MYSYRITAVDLVGNESPPSNEASATISVALPPSPPNLRVTPLPQGNTLTTVWDASGGSASSYNLYRSTIAGGTYTKIINLPISSVSYVDSGLTNGTGYYYVVTSLDAVGNESVPSIEASGTATDTVPPGVPVISFPTTSAIKTLSYQDSSDIAGMAKLGVTVELFKGDVSLGRTVPVDTIDNLKLALDYSGAYPSVSPDGTSLAYATSYSYGYLALKDLSGATKQLVYNATYPAWNSQGTKIAYVYTDPSWRARVGVYDLATGTSAPLTTDTNVYENSPSWSDDGKTVCFLSNKSGYYDVYLKNLDSGSTTRLTTSASATSAKVSPDAS